MRSESIRAGKVLVLILACIVAFTCMCFAAPAQAEAVSNKDFVIFLAPGHTPNPNFTRGGISEGQLNEQLSIVIGNALRSAGYTVYLTNKLKWESTDLPVIIKDAPAGSQYSYATQILPAIETPEKYGVNVQCDLAISVHHNAAYDANGNDSPTARGIGYYYSSDFSYNTSYTNMNYGKDADSVAVSKKIAQALTNSARSSVKYTKIRDLVDIKGTSVSNSICRSASMASVLLEAGFMTQADDLAQIRQKSNMQVLAQSIVSAVNSCRDEIKQTTKSDFGTVTIPGTKAGDKVTIDGREYIVGSGGSIPNVKNGKMAVVYTMHNGSDAYTTYPTGMKVYSLKYSNGKYTATAQKALDNVLQYAGASIRITGKQGIRIISGIPSKAKDALTGSGLNGYTLLEDGLVVAWANELDKNDLTLATCTANGTAYVKGKKNPVYSKAGGVTYYTNTLTFSDMAKTKPDLVMRSYMRLKDPSGNEVVLYGGPIKRSIYYIAKANKDTYKSGTDAYKYIWNIINYCEGKNPIMSTSGVTEATKNQMINYFISKAKGKGNIDSANKVSDLTRDAQGFPNYYKTVGVASISDFVQLYIEEAKAEGVRPDVAFAQMIDETGYLNFRGDVRINQFNFAGIGATGGGVGGATFKDVRTGIRAQIQHLKAYASKDKLKNACVDPRYDLVTKGCAPNIEQLSGTWAANMSYGTDLINIVNAIKSASNDAPPQLTMKAMLSRGLMMMPPAEEETATEPTEIVPEEEKTEGTENVSEEPDQPVTETPDAEGVTGEQTVDGNPTADDQSITETPADDGQETVTDVPTEPQAADDSDAGN